MYARATTIQLRPGMADRMSAIFQDDVVPAAQQQPGFRGGLLLTDPDSGKAIAISLWETEADLTAGEVSGYYQAQMAKLAGVGFVAGPPVRETYQVAVQV